MTTYERCPYPKEGLQNLSDYDLGVLEASIIDGLEFGLQGAAIEVAATNLSNIAEERKRREKAREDLKVGIEVADALLQFLSIVPDDVDGRLAYIDYYRLEFLGRDPSTYKEFDTVAKIRRLRPRWSLSVKCPTCNLWLEVGEPFIDLAGLGARLTMAKDSPPECGNGPCAYKRILEQVRLERTKSP